MQHSYRIAIAVLSGCLIAVAVATGTAGASSHASGESCVDPQSDIPLQNGVAVSSDEAQVTGVIEYENSTQSLTFTYHNLSAGDEFWIDLTIRHYNRGVRIVDTDGFDNLSSDVGYSYKWDGETEQPQLTLTIEQQPTGEHGDHEYAAEPRWAFFPVPNHHPATHLTFTGPGFVGDQFILAGPHSVYADTAGCQDITLVVPATANLSESPAAIVESLAAAADQFEAGPRYSHVNVFALPDPIRRGGAAETHEFWVHESATFAFDAEFVGGIIPLNTWLHEYAHTRQRFVMNDSVRLGEEMQ